MGEYVLESLAWAAVWFVAGLSVGWVLWGPKGVLMRHRDPIRVRDFVIGGLLLILATYSIVSGQMLRNEQKRVLRCLADFTQDSSQSNTNRSGAAVKNFDAIDDIINNVFAAETPAQGREAKDKYDQAMREVRAIREDNPPKVFDVDKCGEK